MKAKKAAKLLRAMDRRFAGQGGAAQREWMESDDRRDLALAASPQASRAAKARYDEFVTGVNPVKLAKAVRRELAAQAAADPFHDYLIRKAAHGDGAAADLADKLGGPPASEVREYAARLRKSSSAEARQLGEAEEARLAAADLTEYERQARLRDQGWFK